MISASPLRRWLVPARGAAATDRALGIDIGSRRIKIVELVKSEGGSSLAWALDEPAPAAMFSSEGFLEPQAAARVIARMLEGRAAGEPVRSVVLPSPAVRVRCYPVEGGEAKLRARLAEDVELRIPGVDPSMVHFAIAPSSDTPAEASEAAHYVGAAARKDAIRAYAGAAAAPDGRPARVTAVPLALANLHAALHPDELDSPVALIHVGHQRTDIVIVHGGAPVLSRPSPVGTEGLLRGMRTVRPELSPADAETALVDGGEGSGEVVDEWSGRLWNTLRTANGAAARQLEGATSQAPLSVRLSGGGVKYGSVWDRFAERAGFRPGVLDPSIGWSPGGSQAYFPALAPAFGAALEALDAPIRNDED